VASGHLLLSIDCPMIRCPPKRVNSKPAVSVHDAANRDVSGAVRYTWPSAHEVAITFPEPPSVGALYQIEVATGLSAYQSRSLTVSRR